MSLSFQVCAVSHTLFVLVYTRQISSMCKVNIIITETLLYLGRLNLLPMEVESSGFLSFLFSPLRYN